MALLIGVSNFSARAQLKPDTINVSIADVEKTFIEKNYRLLAQRYNIDIAQAGIRQARLWNNPNIFFESNFYNPTTQKVFNYGKNDAGSGVYNNGQFQVQVTQLVSLAARRSKLVRVAESNNQLQVLAFDDLLRNLRFILHQTYSDLYYNQLSYKLLKQEEDKLKQLVEVFKAQLQRGAVSNYDVTRLEFELQNIQTSIAENHNAIADGQSQLQVFLHYLGNVYLNPVSMPDPPNILPDVNKAIDSATMQRPDIKLTQEQINNSEKNLIYERSKSIPDMTFGAEFDHYGNAYPNYSGVNVAFELPLFNRNQGNIKVAQIGIDAAKKASEAQVYQINAEVVNAYQKLKSYYDLVNNIQPGYEANLADISSKATENYNKRIIGLLEYLDKVRSYKSAQLNLINLQNNLYQAQQNFNYVTNSKFF